MPSVSDLTGRLSVAVSPLSSARRSLGSDVTQHAPCAKLALFLSSVAARHRPNHLRYLEKNEPNEVDAYQKRRCHRVFFQDDELCSHCQAQIALSHLTLICRLRFSAIGMEP